VGATVTEPGKNVAPTPPVLTVPFKVATTLFPVTVPPVQENPVELTVKEPFPRTTQNPLEKNRDDEDAALAACTTEPPDSAKIAAEHAPFTIHPEFIVIWPPEEAAMSALTALLDVWNVIFCNETLELPTISELELTVLPEFLSVNPINETVPELTPITPLPTAAANDTI
jgi:hypothetical protein